MSLLLALAAVGSTALGVRAECVSLAEAAQRAGVTSLLSAVAEHASSDKSLAALEQIIKSKTEVSHEDKLTVFAPEDVAFLKASGPLDADLLLNHFVDDAYVGEELSVLAEFHDVLESEMARELLLRRDSSGELYITPEGTAITARVTRADYHTCAGMLHVVSDVLVPANEDAIHVKKADDLVIKDLEKLAAEIEASGRSLLNDDREARREQLRAAKRRVALRLRLMKRRKAREARDNRRAAIRAERRSSRRAGLGGHSGDERGSLSGGDRRSEQAKRAVARRAAARRAVAARKAVAEARRAAGRMRNPVHRRSRRDRGGKRHSKKDKKHHKVDMRPRGMVDSRNSLYGSYGGSRVGGAYGGSRVGGAYGGSAPTQDQVGGQYSDELYGTYGDEVGNYYGDELGSYGYN